jgi:hypothetical protein
VIRALTGVGKTTTFCVVVFFYGYNTLGRKLRFPQAKKAQFVTVMGIDNIDFWRMYL